MSKNHYVYYSYEEWGRGYIGVRSTELDPLEDPYMGSFKDESFKPTYKEVIAIFESREEALEAEILLHNFYEVHINTHFANKSKQTSVGFTVPLVNPMLGRKHTEETKKKISEFRKTCVGEKASMYGKTHSEEARRKLSEFRKTCTGERNHMYGRRGENSPIFGITRDEQTRKKMSDYAKRCRWWNDGASIKRSPECPGPGWQLGMIKKRRV
jgi:hypothetical protein